MKQAVDRLRNALAATGAYVANYRSSGTARVLAVAVLGGVVLIAVVWPLPFFLTQTSSLVDGKDLLAARNDVRGTLLQAVGGILIAIGLWYSARTFGLNFQGHVTDRYTKAIEQLGSASVEVRLGGIFALERLARDSAQDQRTIDEVLTAFVREHSTELTERGRRPAGWVSGADVQAAMTVLGRRLPQDERLDFYHSGLKQVRCFDGEWAGSLFLYCSLDGTSFAGSHLERADFSFSTLRQAGFGRVHARRANFVRCTFAGWFFEADLRDANFFGADLTGADFTGRYDEEDPSRLRTLPAWLDGAKMDEANLHGTLLMGVDLSGVTGLTREQYGAAVTDDRTVPPAQFAPSGPGTSRVE